MKAKELMIGDWVRHCNGTPMQVSCIKETCFACGKPHLFYDYNNAFEPIPLTAEILKKNGFIELYMMCFSNKGVEYHFDNYCLFISIKTYQFDGYIYYVHELQQALRLCGLRELADNFKV